MRKRFLMIALLVVAVAAGSWYLAAPKLEKPEALPTAETGISVGMLAPRFNLKDADDKPVAVWQSGKVTVLNFWATWCPPCREEMPELENFARQHGSGVAFYAINMQEPAAKVTVFLKQNHYTMPVLLDSDGSVAGTFAINMIPTTVVLDRTGIIRFRKTGGVTAAELEEVIKGL